MQDSNKVMKVLPDPNRIKTIKPHQRRVLRVRETQKAPELLQSFINSLPKLPGGTGLLGCFEKGPWVNYGIAHSAETPYAGGSPGNLRHRPESDPEMAAIDQQLSVISWHIVGGTTVFFCLKESLYSDV